MKRIALAVLAVGAALAIGLVVYSLRSLDARVARAIEEEGSRIVGTRVRVDSVDIELAAGKGTIHGLRVANPEGYSSEDAISLSAIELAIDVRSIRAQPVRVTRATVGDAVVRFELREDGGSNIEQFRRHISAGSGRAEPEPGGEPHRFAIAEFAFAGGEIFVVRPDKPTPERVHLPDLALRDLGGEQGATGGEIGKEIARAFTKRVIAATASHQVGRAVEKELGEAAGDAAETILRHVLE
jgi:hypothetical protein